MFDFDTKANRDGLDSIKLLNTPASIKEAGHLSMWGAEFEFPTAPFVIRAVKDWAEKGMYSYTLDTDEFRNNVCSWMKMQRSWEIKPDWVVPTYGISASLAIAAQAFANEGEGLISFEPGYDNYWSAVEAGGRKRIGSKLIYTGSGYSVDWDDLERKMADPNNKMLVMCNPHNPTGKVFQREELSMITELAVRYDVLVFSDEIFAECIYSDVVEEGRVITPDQINGKVKVITATSIGKWLSFTGTNQANLIIPDDEIRNRFIEFRNRIHYGSMNPMMVPAYRAAYTEMGQKWIEELMDYVHGNYEMVCRYFADISGFKTVRPQGTYVMWVDASEFCSDEDRLREFLVEKAKFHVDMGMQYFGESGFFRMNLALPRKELEKNLVSLVETVRSKQEREDRYEYF